MRAVVQKVVKGEVAVDGKLISSIGRGFVVFIGISIDDKDEDVLYMADKIPNLRVFEDEEGKMNLSLLELNGEVLLISQFTLLGDVRKGRRPNFMTAAKPERALYLFNMLEDRVKEKGCIVKTGKFQAMMQVSLINDGPVTILLDSKKIF
ncbi:MAG: D-aminoacyl-tRNA deacylase [Thermoanaerobacteraceae bacterium]|nr:D-aminoacyl-tRNA deacylase [Thermoanaerobacteraceae bacterium]